MPATQCGEIRCVHGITIVDVLDDRLVEGDGIEELGQELFRLIKCEGRRRMVVNLSSVELISSGGLGKLLVLRKNVNAEGGVLRLCCIRPDVHRVFAVTRMDRLFDIWESEADAVAAFKPL
jgi:anti-sigma B factor antagonist